MFNFNFVYEISEAISSLVKFCSTIDSGYIYLPFLLVIKLNIIDYFPKRRIVKIKNNQLIVRLVQNNYVKCIECLDLLVEWRGTPPSSRIARVFNLISL